jgi:hypothetical protein
MSIDMTAMNLWMGGGLLVAGGVYGLLQWRVVIAERRLREARKAETPSEEALDAELDAAFLSAKRTAEEARKNLREMAAKLDETVSAGLEELRRQTAKAAGEYEEAVAKTKASRPTVRGATTRHPAD